jgi:hypothetical protein
VIEQYTGDPSGLVARAASLKESPEVVPRKGTYGCANPNELLELHCGIGLESRRPRHFRTAEQGGRKESRAAGPTGRLLDKRLDESPRQRRDSQAPRGPQANVGAHGVVGRLFGWQ